MKTLLIYLIAVPLILLSCGKDDCETSQLKTNIIGTWKASFLSLPAGEVEFLASGVFVSDPNSLASTYFGTNTPGIKRYVVNSNKSLTVTVTNQTSVQENELEITDYSCDHINIETSNGGGLKLKRKD